jgi:hypothetical protein
MKRPNTTLAPAQLTDAQRAMFRAITGLNPDMPSTFSAGIPWLIERAYIQMVPAQSREKLGLVFEYKYI